MSLKHMHEAIIFFFLFPYGLLTEVMYQMYFIICFINTVNLSKFKRYVFHTMKQ